MKIIHTSDWHLGQIFNNYDRMDEHRAFFGSLCDVIEKDAAESGKEPDVLLVSGDVFHNSLPSLQAQRLLVEGLQKIRSRFPQLPIIMTAGNHDSGSRLEIYSSLWEFLDVHIVGTFYGSNGIDLDKCIIPVGSAGFVIALPYINPYNYPKLSPETAAEDSAAGAKDRETEDIGTGAKDSEENSAEHRQKCFYEELVRRVRERNPEGLPVVMMAHLAVSRCDMTGHDDEPLGGVQYTPTEIFPSGIDYVALGHIHHAQTVGAGERGDGAQTPVFRYSGAPVQVNFGESYPHGVSIVEINSGTAGSGVDGGSAETGRNGDSAESGGHRVSVRMAEIPVMVPMMVLPKTPAPFEEALKELLAFPPDRVAYVKLNVLVQDYLPQSAEVKALMAVEGKNCRYCGMKTTRVASPDSRHLEGMRMEDIKRNDNVLKVAESIYKAKFGVDMPEDYVSLFTQVLKEMSLEINE